MVAVADGVAARFEQHAQPLLSLKQRLIAQILAVEAQQVEGEIGEVPGALLQDALKFAEVASAPTARHHHLSIQQAERKISLCERCGDALEAVGPVLAGARV